MDELARLEEGRREGVGQSVNLVTLERFADYSKSILGMTGGAILFFYASSIDFLVCLGLLGFTFLADLALVLLTSFLKQPGGFNERLYIAAKILIYTTDLLMMLTSASLLLLLNPSYAMFTILMLPIMAIVIIVLYDGISTDQARKFTDFGAHQPELKRFFDLSAPVTVAAFGAMTATIFGYYKNFPKNDDQVDFRFSEAFIFFTVNVGLLVMLLTTVPPSLPHHPDATSCYLNFIKFLGYSLSGLLALTGLAVTAEFLGQLNLLAFLPIFLAIVVWFRKQFIQDHETRQAQSDTGDESKPDTSAITITTCIFAALIAVDTNFGSEDNDFLLKTCMFLLSLAFMSSLGWMILAFIRPGTQSLEMPVMALAYSTLFSSVFSVLDLIVLVIRTYHRKGQ